MLKKLVFGCKDRPRYSRERAAWKMRIWLLLQQPKAHLVDMFLLRLEDVQARSRLQRRLRFRRGWIPESVLVIYSESNCQSTPFRLRAVVLHGVAMPLLRFITMKSKRISCLFLRRTMHESNWMLTDWLPKFTTSKPFEKELLFIHHLHFRSSPWWNLHFIWKSVYALFWTRPRACINSQSIFLLLFHLE